MNSFAITLAFLSLSRQPIRWCDPPMLTLQERKKKGGTWQHAHHCTHESTVSSSNFINILSISKSTKDSYQLNQPHQSPTTMLIFSGGIGAEGPPLYLLFEWQLRTTPLRGQGKWCFKQILEQNKMNMSTNRPLSFSQRVFLRHGSFGVTVVAGG